MQQMNENGWENVYDELVKEINAIRDIDTSKLILKTDNNSNIKDIKDDVFDHSAFTTSSHYYKFPKHILKSKSKTLILLGNPQMK